MIHNTLLSLENSGRQLNRHNKFLLIANYVLKKKITTNSDLVNTEELLLET